MPLPEPKADPAPPAGAGQGGPNPSPGQISELRVTGHLMTLDTGLFCVFQAPGGPAPDPTTGLPGVRISLPPGQVGRPEAVNISTFRPDGWLSGAAALVRVTERPAQVLVTVYQAARQGPENAPRLQVLRLSGEATETAAAAHAPAPAAQAPAAQVPAAQAPAAQGPAAAAAPAQPAAGEPEVVAHVQRTGDVGTRFGEWVGTRGSKLWIEGFGIGPRPGIDPADIEYQAVLGRGWLSPWVEAGKFCGSRGMALPLLGIKVRLNGEAAERFDCSYEATFTDGTEVGPVPAGESCESESLAALEAFRIMFEPKGETRTAAKPGKSAAGRGRSKAR
ncbi:MAG: hypothetical protein J0H19_20570 [Rhodospirillales bacterium]|nr:hypothetical protein [Rhodospirillales bacterium]